VLLVNDFNPPVVALPAFAVEGVSVCQAHITPLTTLFSPCQAATTTHTQFQYPKGRPMDFKSRNSPNLKRERGKHYE
jgi:hypothetical protein